MVAPIMGSTAKTKSGAPTVSLNNRRPPRSNLFDLDSNTVALLIFDNLHKNRL
jgi:hypothetical protein